ncbi:MAG: glycosyltransferase [Saprospiraceae bacterium]
MGTVLLQIIFWGSGLALVYTYWLYPLLAAHKARGKQLRTLQWRENDTWPHVSILMAVHNEEIVIRDKLESLVAQKYPNPIHVYIGSDNSSDATNTIVDEYTQQYPHFHFVPFTQRQGKPGVINQLAVMATQRVPAGKEHIFIITDASVMLSPLVTQSLVKHFREPNMAIVDAHMVHTEMQPEDISHSESTYISWEGQLKYNESVAWKRMVGPFGGCYALRSDYFAPVPDNFLVDDFYITMQAFRKGGLAINEPTARCYEPVGHEIKEEFRRKARISAGNLQNMLTFTDLWWPPTQMPQFAIFSHKIVRWLGPIWLILLLLSSGLLGEQGFYHFSFSGLLALYLGVPLLDVVLQQLGVHISLLRSIRYFLTMNLALFAGYFRYFKGIKTNVWQPPKRN